MNAVFLSLLVGLPVAAGQEVSVSPALLKLRVQQELQQEGLSLASLGYALEIARTESGRWIVTLEQPAQATEPLVRILDSLPKKLDAAVAQVVTVVSVMLGRERPTPKLDRDSEPRRKREPLITAALEERIMEYARRRARVIREEKLTIGGYGWFVSGKMDTRIAVRVGTENMNHWEFAQHLAELSDSSVDEKVRMAYDPPLKRRKGLLISGYIAGGVLAVGGLAALATSFNEPDFEKDYEHEMRTDCRPTSSFYDEDECRQVQRDIAADEQKWHEEDKPRLRILGAVAGGVGVAALVGTLVYHMKSNPYRSVKEPYYSIDELAILVARHNKLVREELGLDDTVEREQQKNEQTVQYQPPAETERDWTPTVMLGHNSVALAFTF